MSEVPSHAHVPRKTPLHSLHVELGARMVPFAGYDMPVQFPAGIMAEHLHTRAQAGLFDVSHMGQAFLIGQTFEEAATALEALCPADILGLKPGQQRYSQFLDENGGILDDFMVTRSSDPDEDSVLMLVVNASRKEADFLLMAQRLPHAIRLVLATHRALLALQGPMAAHVLAELNPDVLAMPFMSARSMQLGDVAAHVSRSGYTGEDGYEISLHADKAERFARKLLAHEAVKPIGLGARDSLRLEAGLCLHGHDIDTSTTPAEAGLMWSIAKRRREAGGFPGDERLRLQIANGVTRRRVGIRPDGKQPVREGAEIRSAEGALLGTVTSGGFGPSVGGPVAMGYVEASHAAPGTPLQLMVRGKALEAKTAPLPFSPHRYHRTGA